MATVVTPHWCNPVGEPLEIGRETVKPAYRIRVPIRPDGHIVRAVAHVDTGGVGMHDGESRICDPEPPRLVSSLLPGQTCGA